MGSVEAMKEGSKDRYFQDVEDDIKVSSRRYCWSCTLQRTDLYERRFHQFVGGIRVGMGLLWCKRYSNSQKYREICQKITRISEESPTQRDDHQGSTKLFEIFHII